MLLADKVNQSIEKYSLHDVEQMMEKSNTKKDFLELFLSIDILRMNGQYSRACARIEKRYNIRPEWYKLKDRPRKTSKYRPASDYLKLNGDPIKTHNLRLKLLRDGVKEHKCEICLLSEWNNIPISLELDHINGVRNDNRIENLRVICPNCHSQTDTYKNKNRVKLDGNNPKIK